MAAESGPVRRPGLSSVLKETDQVEEKAEQYSKYFQSNDRESTEKRLDKTREVSTQFYNLVTDFYEYGYGESFHFCPLFRGRPFEECMADGEKYVGEKLKAGPGKKIAVSGLCICPYTDVLWYQTLKCMRGKLQALV